MQIRLLTDAPILSVEQDEVGAARFARRLLKPLVEWPGGEGLVLGLYGSWGSGKTSILNLLEKELSRWEGDSRPHRAITVPFNPWIYSDAEPLLLSFFGTLAAYVGKAPGLTEQERRRLAAALKGIGSFIVPFLATYGTAPIVGALGSAALGFTANKLLTSGEAEYRQARKDAFNILLELSRKEVPNRVVVLIDDLDRAQAKEVLAVLRVVRLIADLPNVSYVLAMDYERVREVLTANRGTSYGAEFLDKIIQVPVSIPPIRGNLLETLTKEAVITALTSAGHSTERLFSVLPGSLVKYGSDGIPYTSTLGIRIRTLRDRARLINNLQFMLLTGDKRLDVHPADAVLISFVHTFYPEVYHRIRRNKRLLVGGDNLFLSFIEQKDPAAARDRVLQRMLRGIPVAVEDDEIDDPDSIASDRYADSDISVLRSVLRFLFPILAGTESRETQDLRSTHRIGDPHRFDRYFELEPPPGEISDEYVDEFVLALIRELDANAGMSSDSPAMSLLVSLSHEEMSSFVEKFQFRLADLIGTSDGEDDPGATNSRTELLARKLFGNGDVFSLEEVDGLLLTLVMQGADPRILALSSRAPEKAKIAQAAISSIGDPSLAMLAAAHLLRALQWNDREFVIGIADAALARFEPFVQSQQNIFAVLDPRDASHIMWRWRDLLRVQDREFGPIKQYLRRVLEADMEYLPAIISLFSAWVSDNTPALDVLEPEDLRASVDSILGAGYLLECCHRAHSLPRDERPQDPHRLIEQCIRYLRDDASELESP